MSIFRPRSDTAAAWAAANPTLAEGEMGLVYDPPAGADHGLFKMGTGLDDWLSLPYVGGADFTPGLEPVDTESLASDQGTVTITIPAGLVACRIEGRMRGTVAAASTDLLARLNGDVGANYQRQMLLATSTTIVGNQQATPTTFGLIGNLPGATAPANYEAQVVIDIAFPEMGLATYRDVVVRCGMAYGGTTLILWNTIWMQWRGTTDLASISIFPSGGSIAAGATFKTTGYKA